MKQDQQAILARDVIDMIRDYRDDVDALEYLDGICFSVARILEENSVVEWDRLAGVCDQRYYSLRNGNPVPLDTALLDGCERSIQKFLPR